MARELTPTRLVYESFKHSQGKNVPQVAILTYVEQTYGITPDFTIDDVTIDPYMHLLSGSPSAGRHVPLRHEFGGVRKAIAPVVKDIKTEYGLANKLVDPLPQFAAQTIMHELERFSYLEHGKQLTPDNPYAARHARRLASRRGSFLRYYTILGHNTGYTEFDELYQKSVDYLATAPKPVALLLERHTALFGRLEADVN